MVVIVQPDQIRYLAPRHKPREIRLLRLEIEFGAVVANDREPVRRVGIVEINQPRDRTQAIRAGVGEEIDDHDLHLFKRSLKYGQNAAKCAQNTAKFP